MNVAFLIVLIAAEAAFALLLLPVGVRVTAHIDSLSLRAGAEVAVYGARVLLLGVSQSKDAVRLRINGKNREMPSLSSDGKKRSVIHLASSMKKALFLRSGRVAVLVGGEDAARGATVWGGVAALLSLLPERVSRRVYFSPSSETLTADVGLSFTLSPLSVLTAVAAYFLKDARRKNERT